MCIRGKISPFNLFMVIARHASAANPELLLHYTTWKFPSHYFNVHICSFTIISNLCREQIICFWIRPKFLRSSSSWVEQSGKTQYCPSLKVSHQVRRARPCPVRGPEVRPWRPEVSEGLLAALRQPSFTAGSTCRIWLCPPIRFKFKSCILEEIPHALNK